MKCISGDDFNIKYSYRNGTLTIDCKVGNRDQIYFLKDELYEAHCLIFPEVACYPKASDIFFNKLTNRTYYKVDNSNSSSQSINGYYTCADGLADYDQRSSLYIDVSMYH